MAYAIESGWVETAEGTVCTLAELGTMALIILAVKTQVPGIETASEELQTVRLPFRRLGEYNGEDF